MVGDGESAEGSIWEALAFGSRYKLDNLVVIFDVNRLGQSEATSLQHDMDTYKKRVESFGQVFFKLLVSMKYIIPFNFPEFWFSKHSTKTSVMMSLNIGKKIENLITCFTYYRYVQEIRLLLISVRQMCTIVFQF